jgi:hypothetical protein
MSAFWGRAVEWSGGKIQWGEKMQTSSATIRFVVSSLMIAAFDFIRFATAAE